MKHKTSQNLYLYWNEVRAGRLAPRRFEIEPGRIGNLLPDTFILERGPSQKFAFRLAGTRLCERLGRELRGEDILNLWPAEDRGTVEHVVKSVASEGSVGILTFQATGSEGNATEVEVLILPLVHLGTGIDRLMGTISVNAKAGMAEDETVIVGRLATHEVIWPDGRPHALAHAPERQLPFLPHIRNARIVRQNRRQFRVYDGGLEKNDGDKV